MVGLLPFLILGSDPIARAFSPSARAVIAHPDRVTIYAVEPSAFVEKPNLGFRDALAARRLPVTEVTQATDALFASLRGASNDTYACFDPHHGLKYERGKKWVKVWICFTCRGIEVQESGGKETMVATGLAGKATFDRLVPKVGKRRLPIKARP